MNFKKLQPIRKRPYHILEKSKVLLNKLRHNNKTEIVKHRNNLLAYSPKDYALCELTNIYSLTGLHIVDETKEKNDQKVSANFNHLLLSSKIIPNELSQKSQKQIVHKQRNNRKKSQQRQSSRLRS